MNIDSLLQSAVDDGNLGQDALTAMNVIPDLGAEIQAGLGMPADSMNAVEVVLVSILIDDSGSITSSGNTDAVISGYNSVLDALSGSKQAGSILTYCRYLNKGLLSGYTPLDKAVFLHRSNYCPTGCTPLYDQSIVLLSTVMAKAQEFSDNGVPVRTITLIVTDGYDNVSNANCRQVKPIIHDMLRQETHIVAAMGVGQTTQEQDHFRKIFEEMGIAPQWVLTPKSDPTAIRQAFAVFSQSATRASQSAGQFSQTQLGGFGGP